MSEERCPSCDRHFTNGGACPDSWHDKYLETEMHHWDAETRVAEVMRLQGWRKSMTHEERFKENVAAAMEWWKNAPRRRLAGDHLPLNAMQQARINGCVMPWPAEYDKPKSARKA